MMVRIDHSRYIDGEVVMSRLLAFLFTIAVCRSHVRFRQLGSGRFKAW